MKRFPDGIQDFANSFVALQAKRHAADHDPMCELSKASVEADVDVVEQAIVKFRKSTRKDRRAFAVFVLLKHRGWPGTDFVKADGRSE